MEKVIEMKRVFTSVILLLSISSTPLLAQSWDFPSIETTGYGEIITKPDMAEFTVRVEESTLTAEDAKKRVDDVVSAFIGRLIDSGVSRDDISAANINLSPKYNYSKSGKSELIGYKASRSITVVINKLDNLNTYLDGAIGDGIGRIDTIQLKVKDQKKYQELARSAAIKDAQDKAHSLAKGFNREIDEVWKVSYDNVQHNPIMMKAASMRGREESSSAGYQDTTLIIKDRVKVIYKLSN